MVRSDDRHQRDEHQRHGGEHLPADARRAPLVRHSGRVLDANGSPVANATVTASADGLSTVTTNSNANGIYAFILPAGDYAFSVSKSGAVGSRAYTVAASSQKTRAESDGWGTGVNNSASGIDVTVYTESDFAKSWRNKAVR